jgi:hypothetical protein
MTDVILIATIVVFFFAAALLVRALGRVVADSVDDAGPEEPEDAAPAQEHKAGRPG